MNRQHLVDTRTSYSVTKPTPARWPSAMTFRELCEYLGFTASFAYAKGLDATLANEGCDWTVPGTTNRLWLKDKVDAWRDRTWREQHGIEGEAA